MTREQFLNALKEALSSMKPEDIDGVIAYYTEMIDDRMEAGMTEEAAVKAMEPVQVIAARVLSEAGVEDKQKKPEGEQQVICRAADTIRKLHITAENRRIVFTTDDTEEITLRYRIGANDVFQLHEDEGVLTLEHHNRPVSSFANEQKGQPFSLDNLLESVGKLIESVGRNLVSINVTGEPPIEVVLPRVYKGFVQAESKNDRICVHGVTCTEAMYLTTRNARILLENVVSRHIEAVTTNGRIVMQDVYAREGIRAVTSNGRILAEKVSSDQELHLTTSNGRVEMTALMAHDIFIKTSNGSVLGTVRGAAEEYTVHSATSNGSNNLGNRAGGEKTLNVVTSNARVEVSFTAEAEG